MITEEDVLVQLNKTGDPGVGIGIVDLGLVVSCDVQDDFVRITLRTTTQRCPFQPFIMMDVHRKLLMLSGVRGAEVEVTNESPWHPGMMSDVAKTRLGFHPSRLELASQQVPEIQVGGGRR